MKLSEKQKRIVKYDLQHQPKITILEGAVRSGKTFLNNALFYSEVRKHTGANHHYIITGHTVSSIKRNVLEPLSEQFGVDTKMGSDGSFSMYGNIMHCFGADKADSYKAMTGMTAHGWYGNEVTLQHSNTIAEAFNRCSGEGARIFWDTNPDYPEHPIKIHYVDKSGELLSNGRPWIQSWHFELTDNPFLPAEYVENIKRTTPVGMWYDRRIKGFWVAAEGLVYEGWNPDVHVIEPFDIPEDWQRVRGIDWGFTNPFVCLWGAIDGDGRLYIYDEWYASKTLIKYHAREIQKRAGKFSWTVADHDAQDNAEIKQYGIYTKPAQKDVLIGIQKVAERMVVQADGKPRLMVFRTCKNTVREIGMYRWTEQRDGKPMKEEPLKVDDHCPDTSRYMIMEIDHKRYHGIYVGD